jgi:succinyl-diaminopimelate desuccinylase
MSRQISSITDRSIILIRIESTFDKPDNLEKVLDIALDELKGFSVETFERNGVKSALISNQPKCRNFKYILNGHLDVVSGLASQFQPFIKNGKLYGRGSQDMKVAVAAMIEVFKLVANEVNYPLGLQIVTDEEVGGHNGTEFQIEQGVTADFVIVGESSDLSIVNRAKGVIKANITALGKSSHGAYPWEGKNAILRMSNFLSEFKLFNNSQNKTDWTTTCDVPIISTSNKEFNKVADDCTVQLDIRYTPEDGADRILYEIERQLPESFTFDVRSVLPAQYTDPNYPDLKRLKKIGDDTEISDNNGATDGKYFTEKGIPVVIYGPKGGGLHQDGEWVDIDSVVRYKDILMKFLLQAQHVEKP